TRVTIGSRFERSSVGRARMAAANSWISAGSSSTWVFSRGAWLIAVVVTPGAGDWRSPGCTRRAGRSARADQRRPILFVVDPYVACVAFGPGRSCAAKSQHLIWMKLANTDTSPTYKNCRPRSRALLFNPAAPAHLQKHLQKPCARPPTPWLQRGFAGQNRA